MCHNKSLLPKGILRDPHLDHMIGFNVFGYFRFIFYNRTDSGRTHRWNTLTESGEHQLWDTCPPYRSVTPASCCARERWTWRCLQILSKISWQSQQGRLLLVCANVFPVFFDLSISSRWFFFFEICFCKEFATNTGESSMSATPSLQRSCLDECVFVGLVDRVQHSSFCDFCMLVICRIDQPVGKTLSPVPALVSEVVHRYRL
jgi:hypothetical protein